MYAAADAGFDLPGSDVTASDDEGGRSLKPELDEQKPSVRDFDLSDASPTDESDDDAGARRLKDLANEATRRAAVIDRDPQSILPSM